MSSEQLADGVNPLDAELAATWDVLKGYSGRDTDLGIARRFGGAAAAYSLRDIGAMNGRVVKVRRDSGETTDPEEDFSANQVSSGALEDWVNGELESTLPADVATAAAAYSLRKVKASYSGNAVRIRRSSDDIEVDVAFDSDGKVSASSTITNVAEEGGESGQTTATTLGDFISGTDAFVHTWYDQAGSNNAVQATAGNQPKIAENGALLADENGLPEIKFTPDASNGKFLSFTTINFSDTMGMFFKGVVQDTGGSARTFSKDGSFTHIVQFLNSTSIVINTTTDATFTVPDFTTRSKLHTLLTASDSANYFGNAVTADSPQAVDMNSDFQLNRIGDERNTSGAQRADFDTSELIFYTSDQTNNRFKIESNINNYYGLYNDANDLAGNFTVNSSGTGTDASISNESKTGFTATVVDKAGFFGADLNEAVPNGSNLYISFNANLSPSGGTAATPNFSLADSSAKTGNSTGSPLDTAVVEGFNSITVAGTASTCDRIRFTEGNDNVSFIISDLKVSRIARNGFVETWYDQSGNGRDMIQATAGNQPSIVSNGGYMNGVYSAPASSSTTNSNKQYMRITGTNSFACNDFTTTKVGMIAIANSLQIGSVGGVSVYTVMGNIRGVQTFPTGALGLQISGATDMEFTNYTSGTTENKDISESTRTIGENTLIGGTMDNRNVKTFTFTEQGSDTDTVTASTDIVLTSQKDFGIFYSTFANDSGGEDLNVTRTAGGYMKEAYILDGDIIDDIDAINLELRQHYNLA